MHAGQSGPSATGSATQVLAALQNGQPERAMALARTLIEKTPQDHQAQYLMGLSLLMAGDPAASLEWLEKAHAQQPRHVAGLCNLGVAHLRADNITDAIRHLSSALIIQPDYREARYNLACALLEDHQAEAAHKAFAGLVKDYPEDANYVCALGDACREASDWQGAIRHYRRALNMDDSLARAHANLAPFLMHVGKLDEAIEHCRRAIALQPKEWQAYKHLGDCLVAQEAFEDGMDAYADAYDIAPDAIELNVAIADVWRETGETVEASSWYQKAIQQDADHVAAQCGLASIINDNGEPGLALERLTPLLEHNPEHPVLLLTLADVLWDDGDADSALSHLRHLQQLQPARLSLNSKIGHILSSSGDIDGAVAEYTAALAINPASIPALSGLAVTRRGKLEPAMARTMEQQLANRTLRAGARAALHNGLAYYYDGNKDPAKAAPHIAQANQCQWESRRLRGWKYDTDKHEAQITQLIKTFDAAHFDRVRSLGNPDPTPVFIVGMPRSGTTLTEQILARHSQVLGIGERNFAGQALHACTRAGTDYEAGELTMLSHLGETEISALTQVYLARLQQMKDKAGKPAATRVVDKLPDNYSLLGWIATLFPNARIIHCRRDPRDVALSCWITQFGAIRWACHTDHLVHRIQQYQRIMAHWRKVIPEHFIEINYEDLVADQENQSRRLIEWIGLDWEPACLSFYESDRLIRTASITQVRQPIYKRSVARWKAYQPYLQELFDPLCAES